MVFGRIPEGEGPSRDIDSFDFSGMRQRMTPRPRRSRADRRAGRLSRDQLIGITAAAGFMVFPLVAARRRRGRGQTGQ